MNLTLSNNTLSGNLMGTPVYGMTRSPFGGASPPAGVYAISPPVSDPMFGMYAILTPVTGASSAGGSSLVGAYGKFFRKAERPPDPVFVLSDRVIPGRNCIVMSLGFADAMSALQSAGGGQITIA